MLMLLNTSAAVCALTLVDESGEHTYEWQAGRELARGIFRFLQEKIGDFSQISGIGVMKGPGSFTGLRIGITVANTLATELGVPIVGEKMSEQWQKNAITRLRVGENDVVVVPFYGAEPHITAPKR